MRVTTLQHIQESVYGDWGGYVGVLTRLWAVQPKNCGSIPSSGKAFFSSSECPHWQCSPLNLYRTDTKEVPRLRIRGAIPLDL